MDVDLLKSTSAQDQMEMLTIMMHLNKFPQLSDPYQHISDSREIEFSGGTTSTTESQPPLFFHNPPINPPSSISFISTPVQQPLTQTLFIPQFQNVTEMSSTSSNLQKMKSMEAIRETIFHIAAIQPIYIDPESVKPPKRKNKKISKDPQSVAARHRRERISERIRILQRLVPGGTKMDTASMLDEAVHYVKFLKKQVQKLEQAGTHMRIGFGV